MTLLEKRQTELNQLIEDIIDCADLLRMCHENGYSDVNDRVRDIAEVAFKQG